MVAYRHLSRDDRDRIAGMVAAGLRQCRIAEARLRAATTEEGSGAEVETISRQHQRSYVHSRSTLRDQLSLYVRTLGMRAPARHRFKSKSE